jgi:hypothetical protein
MKLTIAVATTTAYLLLWPSAHADESVQSPPTSTSKTLSEWLRSGSLELPGVTACHQCEWRPKPHQMGSADRCGTDANGNPKLAEFECGYSEDCKRVCNFTRCLTP